MTITVPEALRKTADFFDANPDKRVTGELARTDSGRSVSPWDPEATCWCALGRFAVEAGELVPEKTDRVGYAYELISPLLKGVSLIDIFAANDRQPLPEHTQAVTDFLRTIATRLETPA